MSIDMSGSGGPSHGYFDAADAELVRLAGRLARVAGWSLEVPSEQIYWTAELYTLLGYEQSAGAPPYDVVIALYPPGHREMVQSAVERCVADGTPMDLESVIVGRDRRELRVRVIAEAVRDEAGKIVRIRGAFYDITEVVSERENRIAAQERLRTTLDYIPDILIFCDETWHLTFANQAAIALADLPAERMYSETIWTVFPFLADTALGPVFERAMIERVSSTARDFVQRIGIWVELTAHPVEAGIAVYARDVTTEEGHRQQIEKVSAHALAQAALLDASNEAMIMEDLDNVVTYWNQGAERIYGWSRQEAVGRNIRELIYADTAIFEGPAEALLRDGRWRGEMEQRTKDGRTVIIECRWQAVLDENGHAVKLFAVNSDVTAHRQQQRLQSRAQRMESLGTLAGGIAHDLNNVLTPLLMSVQLMRAQKPTPDHEAMLEGMEVGVKRGADMIRQVVSFARGVDGVRDVVDLAEVVSEFSAISLQTLPKSITVTTHLDETSPIVGDKTQVLQVLMNLIVNARDSMEGGGDLTLSVRQEVITDEDRQAIMLVPGAYALLTVEDTGAGMTREVLDKVFEPFFTTKELGRGTGLGLASSMAIVKSHGGAISAYSEPGIGSRFIVYLPLATDGLAAPDSIAHEEPAPSGSGELVLVVDDESSIRNLVSLTLEAHGYRVVKASNGRDAIDVFELHSDDVALIFTDMMMPVMDGAATAAYFFTHHPHVAIVATSGLNANGGVARASHSGVSHFISKPFTTDTLLRTVYAALHE